MRWPVQFFEGTGDPDGGTLYCLANDGTVWRRQVRLTTLPGHPQVAWVKAWVTVPPLPQGDE